MRHRDDRRCGDVLRPPRARRAVWARACMRRLRPPPRHGREGGASLGRRWHVRHRHAVERLGGARRRVRALGPADGGAISSQARGLARGLVRVRARVRVRVRIRGRVRAMVRVRVTACWVCCRRRSFLACLRPSTRSHCPMVRSTWLGLGSGLGLGLGLGPTAPWCDPPAPCARRRGPAAAPGQG